MYNKTRWKKKRERILRRDQYLCQELKRYGKSAAATTVHHIFPADQYPKLAYIDANLVSMSAEAHNEMHDRVTNAITDKGKRWQQKVAPLLRKQGYPV